LLAPLVLANPKLMATTVKVSYLDLVTLLKDGDANVHVHGCVNAQDHVSGCVSEVKQKALGTRMGMEKVIHLG
jgi:uncharacterized protein YunC (DUF1805 family)